jgi:hypothetical protein
MSKRPEPGSVYMINKSRFESETLTVYTRMPFKTTPIILRLHPIRKLSPLSFSIFKYAGGAFAGAA